MKNLMKAVAFGFALTLFQPVQAADAPVTETPFQIYQRTLLANQTLLKFGDTIPAFDYHCWESHVVKVAGARKPANTRDLAQFERLTLVMIPGSDTPTCTNQVKEFIAQREKYGKEHHLAVASWNKPDDLANFIFTLAGGDIKGLENVSAIADFKGDFLRSFKLREADPTRDLPKQEVLEAHPALGIAAHRCVLHFLRGRFVGYSWEADNKFYEETSCTKSLAFDWEKAAKNLAELDQKAAAERDSKAREAALLAQRQEEEVRAEEAEEEEMVARLRADLAQKKAELLQSGASKSKV